MTVFKRGANRRERKCSHQGEYLLIHLRRGKIIDSECMIVGGGDDIKNTPTTTASATQSLLHSIKPHYYNMHQNCSKVVVPVLQQESKITII